MGILKISQLSMSFGTNKVLNGLDMVVPEHSIFGFVGKNGAGKTTTMKLVLGLLKADAGEITVCGEKVVYGANKTNRHIGFLPDVPEFYGYLKPREYLRLCGEITGLDPTEIKVRSDELLGLVGLGNINRKISGFSRGMKQRLGIAQALLNEPRLLICDEPTSALDPIGRKEILEIILAVKGKTTVVFSTHILSDVERVCDHVAVLDKGHLVLAGTLGEIQQQYRRNGFKIKFADLDLAANFKADETLLKYHIEMNQESNELIIWVDDPTNNGQFLIDLLAKHEIVPAKFEVMEPTLESLFAEVVQ